jgi:hypothetical protein
MLSPNARNRVTDSLGTRVTVTWNPHVADCPFVSRAEQLTFVVPTGNELLVDGVQLVVRMPLPPDALGFG